MAARFTVHITYFNMDGTFHSYGSGQFSDFFFPDCSKPKQFAERLQGLSKLPGHAHGVWRGPMQVRIIDKERMVNHNPELVLP